MASAEADTSWLLSLTRRGRPQDLHRRRLGRGAELAADTAFSHVLGEATVAVLGCALPARQAGSGQRDTSFRRKLPEAACSKPSRVQ